MQAEKAREIALALYSAQKAAAERTQRRRAQDGMAERRKRGGRSGPAALGYLAQERERRIVLVPDPERAPLVRLAWPLFLELGDVRLTAERLSVMGLRSRHGIDISAPALRTILRNPVYLGGPHEALVDRATFEKAQAWL